MKIVWSSARCFITGANGRRCGMDHDHDLDCPDPIECARVNALYEKFADLAASVWLSVEMDLPEDRQLRWVAELEIAFHKLPDIDKLSLVEMLLAPIAQARGEVA